MIRKIARPMLASVYVIDGVETMINPAGHKESAETVLKKLRSATPREYRAFLPKDPETAAQIVGGVKAGAGTLFALGKAPRLSATLLAATALPTVFGRHAFWEAKDDEDRARRRNGALTDLALAGGVLLATVDTDGKPDMKWRAQSAATAAQKNIKAALPGKSEREKAFDKASDWFSDATDQVTEYIDDNKGDWKKAANKAGDVAGDFLGDARKQTSKFLSQAGDWLDDATDDIEGKVDDLKPSKLEQYKAKRKVAGAVNDAKGWADDAWDDITPSKLEKFKAKRKVNSVVGDLQDTLDGLQPSKVDKFKAKRKVNKAASKAENRAQDAVDNLQHAWDQLDASPSWWQKRKWKKRVNKAEKHAKKAVKKAQKKLG